MSSTAETAEPMRFVETDIMLGDFHLRQMNADDKELIIEKYNEELIQKWMGVASPFEEENFETWLAFVTADQERGTGIWWIIEQGSIPLGQIWFKNQNWNAKISEIGYLAFAEARGKGMVPFLTRQLAELALNKYKMNRVEIRTDAANDTSGHVALKAGFKFEGTLRNGMNYRGKATDCNVYSMVPNDLE